LLENMDPYQYGGGMIYEVGYDTSTYLEAPEKFEAGTPNIAGAAGLLAAVKYLSSLDMEEVRNHCVELTKYALEKLSEIDGVRILGTKNANKRGGLVSFTIDNLHPHDIAAVLNSDGIAIRSGHHCAMPLHKKYGISATARASFCVFNDRSDVDLLISSLQKAKGILG
jgi:cysteine desulfurase/selenocysteine lyase